MIRVLVVDDSEAFLNAAAAVVSVTSGFVLAGTASSGEEGVAQAAAMEPELVLIDLRMPGIGGREAAAQITQARPGTGIVLMTADSGRSRAAGSGANYAVVDKRALTPAALIAVWESLQS